MSMQAIYEYLERIANLIRTDTRKAGIAHGLQPVQLEALHYLSRCNRYSNNPASVADFLGLTKGTVSQTLGVLENQGLIERRADIKDKRLVHLILTHKGLGIIDQTLPPNVLKQALGDMPVEFSTEVTDALKEILRRLQMANGLKTFGACQTCINHLIEANGNRRCKLTGEPLTNQDAEKLCREHENSTDDKN